MTHPGISYSRLQLVLYFLRLGTTGFGGPIALAGYMHRDLVVTRKWISEEEYKEGLALAQLAPGPLAAQLGIYLGYVHYGVTGATLAGLAFVLPSFLMVVSLGMAYVAYGGLPWMQAVFYGVGPAVTGIIIVSASRLTVKSVSKLKQDAIRQNGLLWVLYLAGAVVTIVTQTESLLLFIAGGMIYMFVKAPPQWARTHTSGIGIIGGIAFWNSDTDTLGKIAIFFLKAGAFVFGSGLAIVPFLHSGVVNEYKWLNEQQFVDAVAVAMITPGPVVITVGFIGYLVAGLPGAAVAALATFIPCYLLTILPAPYFKKIAANRSVKEFVTGITATVIGALTGAVCIIAMRSLTDLPAILIAVITTAVLTFTKKLQEPWIILIAAIAGLLLKLAI